MGFIFHISRIHYRAEMQNEDFHNDATREGINKWVSDQTNMKIKNLLAEPLDPMTRLILVNAIYFKGDWAKKFDAKDTRKGTFYRSDGSPVDVDMMYMVEDLYTYHIRELQTRVLELPYKGKSMSMVIFLPYEDDGLANLEAGITANHLMNLQWSRRNYENVALVLPRFNLEESASLSDTLSGMGMSDVFNSDRADL